MTIKGAGEYSDPLADEKPAADRSKEIERLKWNIEHILIHVGSRSQCRECAKEIYWIVYSNGKRIPHDPDGSNHFYTCPRRNRGVPPGSVKYHR